ncbi:unnamed protein product [Symbiodinium natans]|uniref:Uncharacterized protein n=1 Tax=Symbiodinium natans TaxID=878477 RepID=A0A812JHU8_9DINO|nr:unnamed protein product [Symbiodinium natans]
MGIWALPTLLVTGLLTALGTADEQMVSVAVQEAAEGAEALHFLQLHGHSLPRAAQLREVRVFRHCVRRVSSKVTGAKPGYAHASDYTTLPLPVWNTPAMWCTGRGAKLIESEARQLRSSDATLDPSTLRMLVDVDQRDATTADSLLQGFADNSRAFTAQAEYSPLLFDAYSPGKGPGVCHAPDMELDIAQKAQLLKETPMPMGVGLVGEMNRTRYMEVLRLMESFIGIGAAGPLTDLTSPAVGRTTSKAGKVKGMITGAPIVLKRFAQNMLYSHASGILYSNASLEQIYDFSSWIYWLRQVSETPVKLVSQKACGGLSIIAKLLGTSAEDARAHSTVYVGHDSDLDALAYLFNLTWEAPPFRARRPTPPGSSLAFAPQGGGRASVHFAYQDFNFTTDRAGKQIAPVKIVKTSPAHVNLAHAKDWIEKQIVKFAGQDCLEACKSALSLS